MAECLIILQSSIPPADYQAVMGMVTPTQTISPRVFLAALSPTALTHLRAMAGIEVVLTGEEPVGALPLLEDAELLFASAWLSKQGQIKQRSGEGLDWDTPPMLPPDRPS
jgi:hypothetical protein